MEVQLRQILTELEEAKRDARHMQAVVNARDKTIRVLKAELLIARTRATRKVKV